ncbi:MAG: hypothetical protein H0X40_19495 [Chthoniobacterales bacterium]|nr:hypothetical protein [Chthoniobacterales bacterium]
MVDEEALKPIRNVLEHVRERIDYVVHRLGKIEEVRSLAWRCRSCGYIKHFTRPMPAEVAPPCPKCRGTLFEPKG